MLIWKFDGVPEFSSKDRTTQKDSLEGRRSLRTHSPGMCYVRKQEVGQDHHWNHPARLLPLAVLSWCYSCGVSQLW